MTSTATANAEQIARWNGTSGHAWVDAQAMLDQMFEPFSALLVEAAHRDSVSSVLDVGCGTGSTTLELARALGVASRCVGIDISEPMLALARVRAVQAGISANFLQADAQTHRFGPDGFDLIVSRFGVMFFDDPVAAFTNLRAAARDGARLRIIVWRSAAENPFMTAAERAVAPFVPNLPARASDAPGQFAFADEQRLSRVLHDSGWRSALARPIDVACSFPTRELDLYVTRFGPVGQCLAEMDEAARRQIVPRVHAAFEPYVDGTEVRFTAACWSVDAVR